MLVFLFNTHINIRIYHLLLNNDKIIFIWFIPIYWMVTEESKANTWGRCIVIPLFVLSYATELILLQWKKLKISK